MKIFSSKTFYFLGLFILAISGCKKDPNEPMTEKEFERTFKRNFVNEWSLDMTDNAHKTANAKCKLLEGRIETSFDFYEDNAYFINYDSIIDGEQYNICEQGVYSIDYSTRVLTFRPSKTEKKRIDESSDQYTQFQTRLPHTLVINFLDSRHLYLNNSYNKSVMVTNSEGVEVPEVQTVTETIYLWGEKKC